MTSITKIILTLMFVLLLVAAVPGKVYQKVRIHVPVKHHTHVITKTKVKTVHIGVPIKEPRKESHWDESWSYSKKRNRVRLPEFLESEYD